MTYETGVGGEPQPYILPALGSAALTFEAPRPSIPPMESLGHGAQYEVFDLGNGRVRKIPLTVEQSYRVLQGWHQSDPAKQLARAQDIVALRDESTGHVADILSDAPEYGEWFGHPQIYRDGTYDQDKVAPLGALLRNANQATAQNLLRGYVRMQLGLWSVGAHDPVFTFAHNNGRGPHGRVMQLDFGELTFDKSQVIEDVRARVWERSYDTRRLARLPHGTELQSYFNQIAGEEWTERNLDRYWGSGLR